MFEVIGERAVAAEPGSDRSTAEQRGSTSQQSDRVNQIALGIGQDMTLAAFDLLARIREPLRPPLSVVLARWLSVTPTLRLLSRPFGSRETISR